VRKTENMKKLTELRDRLIATIAQHQRAIEAFQNQLAGVDAAIKAVSSEDGALPARRNVKRTVMEIVQEAGRAGVTSYEVVEKAAAKGRTLERGSVSSLLSRFKREGTLTFDGERYYQAAPHAPQEPPLKIVKAGNGG
jgi:hypothetical protein